MLNCPAVSLVAAPLTQLPMFCMSDTEFLKTLAELWWNYKMNDTNLKQRTFPYRVKVVPFDMCWLQQWSATFTLKANVLHFGLHCTFSHFITTRWVVGQCLQTSWQPPSNQWVTEVICNDQALTRGFFGTATSLQQISPIHPSHNQHWLTTCSKNTYFFL